MCTHNLCFEQKYENSQNISTEICHFYSREISLYIAWECFRNNVFNSECAPFYFQRFHKISNLSSIFRNFI